MKFKFKHVGIKFATWLIFELLLNLSGLDNLADYSEFVFDRQLHAANNQPAIAIVLRPPLLSS
jgi:hypothetical protein